MKITKKAMLWVIYCVFSVASAAATFPVLLWTVYGYAVAAYALLIPAAVILTLSYVRKKESKPLFIAVTAVYAIPYLMIAATLILIATGVVAFPG